MITVRHSLMNCMQRGSMISSLRALGKRRMEGININGEEKQIKNANYTRTHRISWARNIVIYWIRRLSVIRGVEVWSCLSLVKHSHLTCFKLLFIPLVTAWYSVASCNSRRLNIIIQKVFCRLTSLDTPEHEKVIGAGSCESLFQLLGRETFPTVFTQTVPKTLLWPRKVGQCLYELLLDQWEGDVTMQQSTWDDWFP